MMRPHASTHSQEQTTDGNAARQVRRCAVSDRQHTAIWLAGGAILTASMWLFVWARANHHVSYSVLMLAGVGMGVVYLALLLIRPGHVSRYVWLGMILMAVLMRLPWFFVPAASGEDYCRYLWDGAVTANGINPYVHAPQDVADGQTDNTTMRQLAQSGRVMLEGINHPQLRTIYPPVAQGAFALAYWITPFDLIGWRIVLLAFDALAALAVLGLLRAAVLPSLLVFFYLWNPLLVRESYGSCHLDLLVAAMVAVFAWALASKRPIFATITLVLAIGVKLWPILLLPFLLRLLWGKWRQFALAAALFALLFTAMAIPFASAFGTDSHSGLLTYSRIWAGRSGVYQVFDESGWWLRSRCSLEIDGHYVGRGLMMLVLLPAALWLGLRRAQSPTILCRRIGLVILLMLLLGPVLWPWYYIAVIPLATIATLRPGLLLWTALLPLCYLEGSGLSATHLTWLVHVPIWLLLAAEWAWPRAKRRLDERATHA